MHRSNPMRTHDFLPELFGFAQLFLFSQQDQWLGNSKNSKNSIDIAFVHNNNEGVNIVLHPPLASAK